MILAKLTCEDCQRSSAAVYEVKDYKPSSEIFPIKLIVCPSVSRWFVVPDKLRSSTKYPGVKFSNLSDIIKADSLHSPTEGLVKEKSSFISLWTGPFIIAILSQGFAKYSKMANGGGGVQLFLCFNEFIHIFGLWKINMIPIWRSRLIPWSSNNDTLYTRT